MATSLTTAFPRSTKTCFMNQSPFVLQLRFLARFIASYRRRLFLTALTHVKQTTRINEILITEQVLFDTQKNGMFDEGNDDISALDTFMERDKLKRKLMVGHSLRKIRFTDEHITDHFFQ